MMLEYPAESKEEIEQRAKYAVSNGDWFNFYGFLTVALHNGLEKLSSDRHSYPAHYQDEQWGKELDAIVAKLAWLHSYDDLEMALYEWSLGKTEMVLTDTGHNTKLCTFVHEKPENEDWYFNKAMPALQARRQKIINEVFDWIKTNFLSLWD